MSSSTSSSRPTSGVSPERNASNRLNTPLSPITRHAGCGSANPARACGPRSARSNSVPICRRVLSATTKVPRRANACRRAARFGVSPTTPRCCAAPSRDQNNFVHCLKITTSGSSTSPTARHWTKCLRILLTIEVSEILVEHQVEITGIGIKGGEDFAWRAEGRSMPVRNLAHTRES